MSATHEPASPRRRWFPRSFSIRAILVLTLLVAVALAWFVAPIFRQRHAIAEIRALATKRVASFADPDRALDEAVSFEMHPAWGPEWIHALLGQELFVDVEEVRLVENRVPGGPPAAPVTEREAQWIGEFPRLRRAFIESSALGDEGVRGLARATTLRHITLDGPRAVEQGYIVCDVGDEGIKLLGNLPQLRSLIFHGRAELKSFAHLQSLEELGLNLPELGPEGIEPLFALSDLRNVSLHFSDGPIPAFDRLEQDAREHWPNLELLSITVNFVVWQWRPGSSFVLTDPKGEVRMSRFPHASSIELHIPRLTPADQACLVASNPQLLEIELTDEALRHEPDVFAGIPEWAQANLPKLARLRLTPNHLDWRPKLQHAEFREARGGNLPLIPNLKSLTHRSWNLSDEKLERIAAHPDLEKINIQLPRPPKESSESLLGRVKRIPTRPGLEVEFSIGEAPPAKWVNDPAEER